VRSVALGRCRGRHSGNSMNDKSMLGCIIRCRGCHAGESKTQSLVLSIAFFTVLITTMLRSVIIHTQGFQECQTLVFQLLLFCCSQSNVLTSTYSEFEAKPSFSDHFKQPKYFECF